MASTSGRAILLRVARKVESARDVWHGRLCRVAANEAQAWEPLRREDLGQVCEAERYEIAEAWTALANWLMAHGRGMMGVMVMHFTAVFKKVPEGYVAYVEELPGANTQGTTMDEARENLREAVQLVLEANRELSREELGQGEVIREDLRLAVG